MEQIRFALIKDKMIIEVPVDILKSAAEGHPDLGARVKNKTLLAKEVMYELEYNLGSTDSGLTGFKELLDTAIEDVYESASDAFDYDDE